MFSKNNDRIMLIYCLKVKAVNGQRNDRHPWKVVQSFILPAVAGIDGGLYEHT